MEVWAYALSSRDLLANLGRVNSMDLRIACAGIVRRVGFSSSGQFVQEMVCSAFRRDVSAVKLGFHLPDEWQRFRRVPDIKQLYPL